MIYLDNASTTMLAPEVLDEMMPYLEEQYGNPGTVYSFGKSAREAVELARKRVADFIGAKPSQIIFTSGGTEANNMALKCSRYGEEPVSDIVISEIEHDSIRKTAQYLQENHIADVKVVKVNKYGLVENIDDVVTDSTELVSIMYANNEIGSANKVKAIGKFCNCRGILFHSDCVQAAGCFDIDVNECGFDMISISSHKIHGPKGVGALFVRDKQCIEPLIHGGGHQEFGLRGGTENVAGIVGFGKACELCDYDKTYSHIKDIKQTFYSRLTSSLDKLGCKEIVHLNAIPLQLTQSKVLSLRFDNVDAETLVLLLSTKGVYVSAGSACRSLEQEPSHVLTAIGLTPEKARNTIRFSFSKYNSIGEVEYAAELVAKSVFSLYRLAM